MKSRAVVPFVSLLATSAALTRSALAEEPRAAAPSSEAKAADQDLAHRLRERVARSGGLTAEEAARRAVMTSTEDRARAADVEAADAEVRRTTVDYFPRVTLSGRYTRFSAITPPPIAPSVPFTLPVVLDQFLAQANLVVPLSSYLNRLPASRDAADRSREAATWSREAARRAVGTNAKLRYYAWARMILQQAVTEQSVAQSKRHLDFARAARETGRAPQAEVLRAESLLASAELLNERTRNAAKNAEERLRTLLHDERPGRYEIGEDLLAAPGDWVASDPQALLREALNLRPELRALAETKKSIAAQRSTAKANELPRIDGFGNAYLGNPNPRYLPPQERWDATWDVGVQVTFSPNDLGGADAAARALDAKTKKLDAERAGLVDAVRDEIAEALVAGQEARFALSTAEHGLESAEEAYRVRRELFELGRGTNIELIDAESDVLRARLEMIQAKVDARLAKVRLDHAVGRDALR